VVADLETVIWAGSGLGWAGLGGQGNQPTLGLSSRVSLSIVSIVVTWRGRLTGAEVMGLFIALYYLEKV